MTTGELLKSLLDIATMKQKDFAKRIFASASKISKIISSKLLISPSEAQSFSEQAARIFADELYDTNCYFKFRDIFPVIFDFTSRHDLNDFLFTAFQYAIEHDHEAVEEPHRRNYKNKYYSGHKQILYIYSIILSDYLKRDREGSLEFYSALQQFFGYYAELQSKIIILPPDMQREIVFHQFFDPEHLSLLAQEYRSDVLETLFRTELYTDLYRWEAKVDVNKPFLLAKGKFIMLFDKQIDDTPQLTLIRNLSDLDHFYDLIMEKTKEARCLTYNSDTIHEYLDRKESETDKSTVAEKIRHLLATTPAGYPADSDDDYVAVFYSNLLEGGASIYMSADSIESFLFKSEIIVPYLSTLDVNLQERIDYLTRIRDYIDSDRSVPVYIINTQLNSLSLLIDREWSLVSLVHPLSQRVKYHIIASDFIGPELEKAVSESGINITDYINKLITQAKKQQNIK